MIQNSEFETFVKAEIGAPTDSERQAIWARIEQIENPSPIDVFAKLNFTLLIAGLVAAYLLPGTGEPVKKVPRLNQFLDQMNPNLLTAFLSVFLLGFVSFFAAMVMKREELRVLRRYRVFQVPVLALIGLLSFALFGVPVMSTLTAVWVLGASFGFLSSIEIGHQIKERRRNRVLTKI